MSEKFHNKKSLKQKKKKKARQRMTDQQGGRATIAGVRNSVLTRRKGLGGLLSHLGGGMSLTHSQIIRRKARLYMLPWNSFIHSLQPILPTIHPLLVQLTLLFVEILEPEKGTEDLKVTILSPWSWILACRFNLSSHEVSLQTKV